MNTWAYLILIVALTLLAVAMLYAKFASRSRERSLHHAPMDLLFTSRSISAATAEDGELVEELLGDEGGFAAGPTLRVEPIAENGLSSTEEPGGTGEAGKRDSDFFDELQEAAAGLAALMRSSPVGRVDPVVFAPEADAGTTEDVLPPPDTDFALTEEVEILDADSPVDSPAEAPLLRSLLGDDVVGKFDQIDLDLVALEFLVQSIESNLLAFDTGDEIAESVTVERSEPEVSVAA